MASPTPVLEQHARTTQSREAGVVRSRRARRRRRAGVLTIALAPAFVLLLIFMLLPLAQGVRLSFTDWPGVGALHDIGVQNYKDAFSGNTIFSFWSSMRVSVEYSVMCTVGIVVLATLLAAVVRSGIVGAGFYRVVWFLPGIAPVAAVAVFWTASLQPQVGAVNDILGSIGLGNMHSWLGDPSVAIYPAVFVTIWASVGFAFLLILGSMEQIPVSLYEAMRVDGAGQLRMLFTLTLPLIRPVLAITTLLEFIWSFNGFTTLWAMTRGGPGYATSILPVLVYKTAFEQTDFGMASTLAVLGGALLLIVGAIGLRLSQSTQAGR